ncbi:gluconate 2-dehydrogenase subunit 3 family protein [Arenibacter algicola]|uniref:gluconate 2-dehydrogenase subunit 3 family protein n=1 Tax=Arenibacter algicola TaxID=616991 RepID=UPI001C06B56B|nr:gluconate 2-dehydrogenase subunit 3 family protein [Arenibacter algicola]MBU2905337.1 gluconate 2-dehydrogenase subunit 3 family protein [Arenibacter algicola]
MDRRKVLIQMGVSLGYVVATPTLISLLQSCKNESDVVWSPEFLNQGQGFLLILLVDAILPKTDTPSASEVNAHIFLDSFAKEVMDKKEQDQFRSTLDQLLADALKETKKEKSSHLTTEDLAPIMQKALKQNIGDELAYAKKIRDLTVYAYKCNEYIGEEVLAYLPVPGEYIPCSDLEKLTGGKAWSL